MQDPEFKHALTSLQIRGFPPDKFIRWVCWRTGLPKDTYAHLDLGRYPSTERLLLEYPNLPETIRKCFEDYLPISDIFTAISPMGRHFGWAHLPLETEDFQTFCKKYAPSEQPSTKVLSWFIGALPFYNLSDPVVVYHKDEHAITRPLPGTPRRINLTLLKGNLGDENANSHIVNKVLQQLDSTLPSLHYLIGVSGAGKTKALFDIGRKNVSIYFDFKNGELEDSLKKNVEKNLNDVQYIQKTEYEIGVLYATRLVLLMIMKLKNPYVTNEQLLLVQINGYSQERRSWYSTINAILRGAFKERADIETVIDAAYFFLGITKATLFILCDEAQELLPIADGKFKSPDNSEDRSLFHKLVSETIGYGNAIVAGTSLALMYFEQLKSVTAKPRGQEIIKAKHADFKYITSAADCRQIVERLFDVQLSDDHVQYILHKLQGRARFIVNLTEVAQLDQYKKSNSPGKSNEEILMDIVDALFCHLTTVNRELQNAGIPEPYTPAAIINSNFDKERQAYANLIGIYYFDQKELPDIESGSKFFSNGLVGVVIPSGEDTHYQITEPLIVTAILNTFKRKQQSVAAEYLAVFLKKLREQ